jgi:hypothetical protein
MSGLTTPLKNWMAGGHFVCLDDVELFYRTSAEGDTDLPWLVCFHGFPTSSWDWHLLLPDLEKTHRVLVFDFPGYGLSGKPVNRNYSLRRQLDAAQALLNYLCISEFDLLAHDIKLRATCESAHAWVSNGPAPCIGWKCHAKSSGENRTQSQFTISL